MTARRPPRALVRIASMGVAVAATLTACSGAVQGAATDQVGAAPPTGLCQGLSTSRHKVPYSPLARPVRGQAVIDPDFHARIVRVTDVRKDWGGSTAVPVYPTIPTWNADESLMLLYVRESARGNYALLDGKTYAFKKWLTLAPADLEQFNWDPVDPDVLWYVSDRILTRHHVGSGTEDRAFTFPARVDWGSDPIYFSWDGRLFGLREREGKVVTAYRRGLGMSAVLAVSGDFDSPEACPSGKCLLWSTGGGGAGAGKLLDPVNLTTIRNISLAVDEHGDLGLDSRGNDFWAMVSYNSAPGGASGTLMVEWLRPDGTVPAGTIKTVIGQANGDPYPPPGTLISAKAFKAPGWVVLGVTGDPQAATTYLDQEIVLANVETGEWCRAAHHRTRGKEGPLGYWAQPNVTFSPSGTRVVFPSDWGGGPNAPTDNTIDTYVLELPSYRP
jgi:hypothetical protein